MMAQMKYWELDRDGTHKHRLQLDGKEESGGRWWSAYANIDGCVEITRVFNVPFPLTGEHPQLVDSIHVCDLEEFIEILLEIKKLAKNHFGN